VDGRTASVCLWYNTGSSGEGLNMSFDESLRRAKALRQERLRQEQLQREQQAEERRQQDDQWAPIEQKIKGLVDKANGVLRGLPGYAEVVAAMDNPELQKAIDFVAKTMGPEKVSRNVSLPKVLRGDFVEVVRQEGWWGADINQDVLRSVAERAMDRGGGDKVVFSYIYISSWFERWRRPYPWRLRGSI
jgi:hypothetical protein